MRESTQHDEDNPSTWFVEGDIYIVKSIDCVGAFIGCVFEYDPHTKNALMRKAAHIDSEHTIGGLMASTIDSYEFFSDLTLSHPVYEVVVSGVEIIIYPTEGFQRKYYEWYEEKQKKR